LVNSGGQQGNIVSGVTTPTGTGGLGTPTANTIAPLELDNGPTATPGDPRTGGTIAGTFGAQTFVKDVAGANSLPAQDAGTPPRPVNTAGSGSHTLAFTNPTSSQVIFKDTLVGGTPALFYNFGAAEGLINNIDYSSLVVHAALAPLPAGTTVSVEIVGAGTGAAAFDIRTPCTGTIPTTIAAAASILTCPLPAYGTVQTTTAGGFVLPGAANSQIPTAVPFPNAINPAATGEYVPTAGATLYFVLNLPAGSYGTGVATAYTFSVDNVYAVQ
jgi:hypothetical protein